MKITRNQCRAALVVFVVAAMPVGLAAQEEILKNVSPNVRALRSLQQPLLMFSVGPFNNPIVQMTSPDAQALQMLNEAASAAASELRSAIDLLAVYDSLRCEPDRAMLKPLLKDRLRLYSRLLALDAEKASLPLGPPTMITVPATSKRALKLHDDVMAAKNKLDEIGAAVSDETSTSSGH